MVPYVMQDYVHTWDYVETWGYPISICMEVVSNSQVISTYLLLPIENAWVHINFYTVEWTTNFHSICIWKGAKLSNISCNFHFGFIVCVQNNPIMLMCFAYSLLSVTRVNFLKIYPLVLQDAAKVKELREHFLNKYSGKYTGFYTTQWLFCH